MTNILIVAGGTGGHIIPAVSFGQWAKRSGRAQSVLYVSGNRPIEKEIYNHYNIDVQVMGIEGSPIGTHQPVKILQRSLKMLQTWQQIRKGLSDSAPEGVFLFGGYVSLPFVLACREKHIPLMLHEQNARAGKVTRVSKKLGVPIASGWSECAPLQPRDFQCVKTPTRCFDDLQPEDAWNKLNLGREIPSGPIVVVWGGSLGSSRITELVHFLGNRPRFKNWTFLVPGASESNQWSRDNVCLLTRVWDPDPLFTLADMALSRAGGSTLAELENQAIPAVVVPWPNSSDNHQFHNARLFSQEGLGEIWTEDQPIELLETKFTLLDKNRNRSGTERGVSLRSAELGNERMWQMVFESK